MTDLLSLTKIGNIKLGRVVNGNPLALERMLVTRATKENEENFQPYPNFDKKGLDKLTITLPFNDNDLNFEVNYITFLEVDKVEYIAKSPEIGKEIILHPLNPEDFDKPSIDFGKLKEDMIEKYGFKYTGFLKVMIPGVSSFGEVFYFKTGSINTIRAIKDQLKITKTLLGGKIANIPLVLKPVKKDISDGTQVVFLSIGLDTNRQALREVSEDISVPAVFNFDEVDKLYKESRDANENIVAIDKKAKVSILKKNEKEVVELQDLDEKVKAKLEEEITEPAEIEVLTKYAEGRQLVVLIKYLNFLKGKDENYIETFATRMEEGIKPVAMLKEIG